MQLSLKQRRLLLLIAFLWGIGFLFVPIRREIVEGYYTGDSPDNQVFTAVHEVHDSALAFRFDGSPGGIPGLLFFALMPFFVTWESFSFKRPFTLPGKAFLQLQALLLFLGAPYCYYMITYQEGFYYDTKHSTGLAWGGIVLIIQDVLLAAFLFIVLFNQQGKAAKFFNGRE